MSIKVTFKTVVPTEVLDIVSSGVKPFDGKRQYVDTSNVEDNRIVGDLETITYLNRKSRANMEAEEGDVLFAKMAKTHKVILVSSDLSKHVFSTGFFVLRAKKGVLLSKYLYYWLRFEGTELLKDRFAHGETQMALNSSLLASKFKIPVPFSTAKEQFDLNEQERIVESLDKIEAVSSHLHEQQIQSVNLLNAERENAFNIESKYFVPLTKVVSTPPYRYPTFYGIPTVKNGTPVLKISNMTDNAKLPTDKTLYDCIPEEASLQYPKTIVEENDLVMEVRGTYIGKTAIVPKELAGSNISPNTIRISPNREEIVPEYFWHYTFTSAWKNQVLRYSRFWKLGFGTIRSDRIDKILVPKPLKSEQEHALRTLAVFDDISVRLTHSFALVEEALQVQLASLFRESLLACVFSAQAKSLTEK